MAEILFLSGGTSNRSTGAPDEAQRKAGKTQIARDFESKVDDWKGYRISNFGELLLEDILVITKSDTDHECHVLLFQKVLVCCKEVLQPRDNKMGKINSNPETPISGTSTIATPGGEAKKNTPLSLKGCIPIRDITQATPGSSSGMYS